MEPTLRKSMAWLHTWAGVVVGALLFAIFWMGSLSVFDREIDRWMMPATRAAAPPAALSIDKDIKPLAEQLARGSKQWTLFFPGERAPVASIGYTDPSGQFRRRYVDHTSATLLPEQGSYAGTGFIFPFHYSLHIKWMDVGYWLVGIAGMAMLVLLVSGVIMHKKIFTDFFTFRPRKHVQRASLDLHTLTGVVVLPFHFIIALSGLFIFFSIYFPGPVGLPYKGDKDAVFAETHGIYKRAASGTPAPAASIDAMVRDAEARWSARLGYPVKADNVRVTHPGDAASYVYIRAVFPANTVGMNKGSITYNAVDGTRIVEHYAAPVRKVHAFFAGLHFIQFEHWTLRWLYFVAGLAGCVMIATGFLFWLEARRARHARQGLAGVTLVEGLTVGSVTGIIAATLVFFIANRLLPQGFSVGGYERATVEMWAFYTAWLATFAHAWLRPGRAWHEQCKAVALLAVLAVGLNWATTGHHLAATLTQGLYGIAGMDLTLLAGAVLALIAARRLQRAKAAPVQSRQSASLGMALPLAKKENS